MRIIKYDRDKYDLIQQVKKIFKTNSLDTLHLLTKEQYGLFEVGKDSSTVFHKFFYDSYRAGWPEFVDCYRALIRDIIRPQYNEPILFQSFPTFRVHLPDNIAVGAFHTDAEFGHPAGEVNYVLPMTDSGNTASIWVESEPGKMDFTPMELFTGEIIEFLGNKLTHGNKVNRTGQTRVSIDFRVLPLSRYDETNEAQSITQKTKFKAGEYYTLLA